MPELFPKPHDCASAARESPGESPGGFLDFLADSLVRAIADNGEGVLVYVSATPDGHDVGVLPLDDLAPTEVLFGAVAPHHWSALGVAALGHAWPLDRPAGTAPAGSGNVRAGVVVLVARDGRLVSRVGLGDRVLSEVPRSGRTLDCLQRALGLPSAPPDVPPVLVGAVLWLEGVLRGEASSCADLRTTSGQLDGSLDWDRLRRLVVGGAWPDLCLTTEEAAWLDDGAFSRWVMGQCRPLPVLLAGLRRVLDPADARRIDRLVRGLARRWQP